MQTNNQINLLVFSSNVQVNVLLLACGYIVGQLTDARLIAKI